MEAVFWFMAFGALLATTTIVGHVATCLLIARIPATFESCMLGIGGAFGIVIVSAAFEWLVPDDVRVGLPSGFQWLAVPLGGILGAVAGFQVALRMRRWGVAGG